MDTDTITVSKADLEREIASAVEHTIADFAPEAAPVESAPADPAPEPTVAPAAEVGVASFTQDGATVTRHHADGDAVLTFSDESAAADYVATL